MSDEVNELENLRESSTEQPERPGSQKKPVMMMVGIAVIVLGTLLLAWVGPTFNLRKPPPPVAVDNRAHLRTMLQGLDTLDSQAKRAKLPELVRSLRVDDDDIRLGACLALGQIGPDAVPELVPLLDDADVNVRYYAVWALGQVGPKAGDAVPAVLKALKDPDGDVRRKAVFALGRIKPDAGIALPVLIGAFQDDDVEVRTTAVDALAGYGKAAVPALIYVLQQQKALEPRRLAVLTLTQIGPDSQPALHELRPLFLNSNSGLPDEAATALGAIGKPAIPTLAEALQTAPTDPAAQVMRGLGSPWVMLAAWQDFPEQHRRALQALRKIGPDALDQLVVALQSPNSDIRQQAAGVLGAIGFRDRRVVIPLVDAMRDPEATVRKQAGWALRELSPEARTVVPGLAKALRDERPEVRLNAVDFLGQLGAVAVPSLVQAVNDPDANVQRQAVRGLQELRADNEILRQAVIPLLKDERPKSRQSAVAVLHRCGPMALSELTGALADKDGKVRLQVIQALQSFPPDEKKILPSLAAALKDDDAAVRAGAAAGLGRYGLKAVPSLAEALKDKDAAVRLSAIHSAAQLGTQQRIFPLLTPALKDEDPSVRQAAVAAVSRFGARSVPFLVAALQDPDEKVWEQVRTILKKELEVPQKVLLPALAAAIKSDNVLRRQGAADAMSRFNEDGVPYLIDALKDPDPNVRWWAANSLDDIGPPARKAITPLLATAVSSENKPKIRQTAVMALVTIQGFGDFRRDSLKAIPGLILRLDDADPEIRWGASQTLAAIGPPAKEAIPALTKLLQDKDLNVSESARYALKRIQGK